MAIQIGSDPRYRQGIALFNECEFFEAHDVWEELWQEYAGDDRTFLQGLIQVAVCLHHFVNGNARGAVKLYHSSRNYLRPYLPRHHGLDLETLFRQLEECCREIVDADEEFPRAEIPVDRIPELVFAPPTEEGPP